MVVGDSFRLVFLEDERGLAQPEPLFRPLLNGGFERCTGESKIVSIDEGMTDFAVRAPFVRRGKDSQRAPSYRIMIYFLNSTE
jgi:hypothetical protein